MSLPDNQARKAFSDSVPPLSILVAEDDYDLREALADSLEMAGFAVLPVASGEEALRLLARERVDMVVSDVNMGGMDGHQLLEQIRARHPQIPVLLITAYASVARSVAAMRAGAVDYLVKPFAAQVLIDAVRHHAGAAVQAGASERVMHDPALAPVAVDSRSLETLALARRMAAGDTTVLVAGESGTGKEVLARYIHQHSPRANQPFVAINCAAIPDNMLEATLFGYEKGAFTGAVQAMPGKFEQAEGGTLLLDEISEMPPALQAKLLRVLQEREVERLGSRKLIRLDVRVIATTNRDLREAVAQGQFREDLYFRLCVLPLTWLPLRERKADIVPLAQRLLARHAGKQHRGDVHLTAAAEQALLAYHWPGNVRELDNVVQRALILQPGNEIDAADLLIDISRLSTSSLSAVVSQLPAASVVPVSQAGLGDDVRHYEYQVILDALQHGRGSRKEAAEKLGISPRTLRYKLAQMRESGMLVDAMQA